MSRYAATFARLRREGRGAFVPFTVLGDPDPDTSRRILAAMAEGGADALELGIPFSDPVADGPVIQAADLRALRAGTTPPAALRVVRGFRRDFPDVPAGLLVYANLVHARGPERFYEDCARCGVDSVLVADLPLEEAGPFREAAARAGVETVLIVTPLSSEDRVREIAAAGGPFLYVVSRAGVTGADATLSASAGPLLRRIRRVTDMPALLGFGIGRPAQVREAIRAGADGAISGSTLVEILHRHLAGGTPGGAAAERLFEEVRGLVRAMKEVS